MLNHFLLLALLTIPSTDPVVSEHIVVTAEKGVDSDTEVIDKEVIEQFTMTSSDDVFNFFPSLYLNTRGVNGVQSDISFRGARGNQVGIFVNGVPFNNLQTYHHNFDIPVAPEDMERFSINSSASGIDNPYSFSGSVDILVKDNNQEVNHVAYGSDDYYHIYSSSGGMSVFLEGSAGYKENTDYHMGNFTWQYQDGDWKYFTAYNSKHFGAEQFYAPYPSYEETDSIFLSATYKNLILYSIRHTDEFFLDRENPEFYHNTNISYSGGARQGFDLKQWGYVSYNVEFFRLESSNMFDPDEEYNADDTKYIHDIYNYTVKYANIFNVMGLTLRPGFSYVSYNGDHNSILPFVSVFKRYKDYDIAVEMSKSVRVPDFTERFYNDPYNAGNSELEPEEAVNLDVSIKKGPVSLTLFYRDESNVIDWIRENDIWHSVNITDSTVKGVELQGKYKQFHGAWQMVSRNTSTDFESKYYFYTPKNKYTLNYANKEVSLTYQYLDIPGLDNASVIDMTFLGSGFYLKVKNASDEEYQTLPGIIMPGRTYIFGWSRKGKLF